MIQNKITVMLLALLLIFPRIDFVKAETDPSESIYLNQIQDLIALNIMEVDSKGNFHETDTISRSEFAKIVTKLSGLDEDSFSYDKQFFVDVPKNHWAFPYITYCVYQGYMSGGGDATFRPESDISLAEALRTLIHLLGYGYKAELGGGYPNGYFTVANELRLLKGIPKEYYAPMTRETVAALVHAALDIPVAELSVIGDDHKYIIDDENTLLTRNLKVKKETGLIRANEFMGIGGITAPEGTLLFQDKILKISSLKDIEYLGFRVTCLYPTDTPELYPKIIRIYPDSDQKILTIDTELFEEINEFSVVYRKNKEQQKTDRMKISRTADIYFNGELQTGLTSEQIRAVKIGHLKLIDYNNDNTADLVLIEEYKNMVVGPIHTEKQIVADKNNISRTLDLGQQKEILLLSPDGNICFFSDIKENMIITYMETPALIIAYLSSMQVEGIYSEIDLDEKTITVDEKNFSISPDVQNSIELLPVGSTIRVYLDYLGKVAFAEGLTVQGGKIAYLMKIGQSNSSNPDSDLQIRLYIPQQGIKTYSTAQILTLNYTSCKNIKADALIEQIKALLRSEKYQTPVLFYLNAESQVKKLEIPRTKKEIQTDGQDGFAQIHEPEKLYYVQRMNCFGYEFFADSNTILLQIPDDPENAQEQDFSYGTVASYMGNLQPYTISAYALSAHDDVVDLVVMDASSAGKTLDEKTSIAIVKDVSDVINQDGYIVTRAKVFLNNAETYFDFPKNPIKDKTNQDFYSNQIGKGDVIRFTTNYRKELDAFTIHYDYSENRWFGDNPSRPETINATNRMSYQRVLDLKNNILTVEPVNASPSATLSEEKYIANMFQVYKVISNNNYLTVQKGVLGDVEYGDIVVIQTINADPNVLIIYRD